MQSGWRLVPRHDQEVHKVKLPFAFPARSPKTNFQISSQCLSRSLTERKQMVHLLRQRLSFWWVSAMKTPQKGQR
jgi:hypothetical protein